MAVIENPPDLPDCNGCKELESLFLGNFPKAYLYKNTEFSGDGKVLKLKKGDCFGLVYAKLDGKWEGNTKCLKKGGSDGLEEH